jgi:uncharacterized membrane-anchored protein
MNTAARVTRYFRIMTLGETGGDPLSMTLDVAMQSVHRV